MTPIIVEENRLQQSTLLGQTIKWSKWPDVLAATSGNIGLYFQLSFKPSQKSIILDTIKRILQSDMKRWMQKAERRISEWKTTKDTVFEETAAQNADS